MTEFSFLGGLFIFHDAHKHTYMYEHTVAPIIFPYRLRTCSVSYTRRFPHNTRVHSVGFSCSWAQALNLVQLCQLMPCGFQTKRKAHSHRLSKAASKTHQLHLLLLRLLPTERADEGVSTGPGGTPKLSGVRPPFPPGRAFILTYSNSESEAWNERCLRLLAMKLEIQIESPIQMKSQIRSH